MPSNMISNPDLTPLVTYPGIELLYVEVDTGTNELVFTGGVTYSRVIFDLDTPMVPGETYLLVCGITGLEGGINPQLQITCGMGGPMNLVSGENRFTVREDLDVELLSKLVVKGSGAATQGRLSGVSLTE